MLPAARAALDALIAAPDTVVALVSGRSLHDLREIAEHGDDSRLLLAGSHGAEFWVPGEGDVVHDDDPAYAALRDGMNLVAKEYVAARTDNRGVLVLSEFAGAADELGSAIRVNPHDIGGLKDAIMRAVEMPAGEQGRRMRALRRRVLDHTVADWSHDFLEALSAFHTKREEPR